MVEPCAGRARRRGQRCARERGGWCHAPWRRGSLRRRRPAAAARFRGDRGRSPTSTPSCQNVGPSRAVTTARRRRRASRRWNERARSREMEGQGGSRRGGDEDSARKERARFDDPRRPRRRVRPRSAVGSRRWRVISRARARRWRWATQKGAVLRTARACGGGAGEGAHSHRPTATRAHANPPDTGDRWMPPTC